MNGSAYLYGGHVRANQLRQHYLRYGGRGRPVILVPGITSPAVTWGFVGERLGQSFDTYILDVRGRGLSEAGPALDYGLNACASDVMAFAEALNLEDYAVIGHSMGARIAIRLARSTPPSLERIVLVDPPVSGPGRRPYPSPLSWYLDSIRLMAAGGGVDQLRPFLPTWSDQHLRLRAEWLHTCDQRAVIESYRGFHEDNIHEDVTYIRIPTLLVVAGKGGVVLPADVEELKAAQPALAIKRVESAGHMIPWDDYEAFFAAIGSFLGPTDLS
jgi:N-formylmaleamate deformylase